MGKARRKRRRFLRSLDVYLQEDVYKLNDPPKKSIQVIGIQSGSWLTDYCYDFYGVNDNDLTHTIFDTTTRVDAARVLLTNSTGATRVLTNCTIHGKLIRRFSGKDGFIHDDFVDYESIRKNGEKKLEIGNNLICLVSQVNKIADYHCKYNRNPEHLYSLSFEGTRHYFEPGEWYTLNLNITTAGIDELMNMKCRCVAANIERSADSRGVTEVILEEVIENWTFDSNSVARYLLSGNLDKLPVREKIVVAAVNYGGTADYYCDGTADEVEFNKAIVHAKGAYGGGIVEITEGKFVTAASILLLANVVFQGRGWNSIIEKNGNFHGIHINGSSGSEIENVLLRNFKITKDDGDTYLKDLIYATYVNNLIIDSIWADKPKYCGANLTYCENPIVHKCVFSNSISLNGLLIASSPTNPVMAKVNNCMAYGNIVGIGFTNIEDGIITGCTCRDNSNIGIYLENVNLSTIVGNLCKDNGGGSIEVGIYISNSDNNIINANICEGNSINGIELSSSESVRNVVTGNRSTGNTTNNFVDNGTATTDSGNDWN